MQNNISIYDKYGGWDFFHKCVFDLYLDLFDHPEISYHFLGVDIERLAKHQTQFLVRAIGGPQVYTGRPIKIVHHKREISLFQFQEIAKSFHDVFVKNGVSPEDANTIMEFVASFQKEVVEVRLSKIDRFMIPIYAFFKKYFRISI